MALSIIDTHTHLYPDNYLELLRQRSVPPRVMTRDDHDWLVMYPDQEGGERPGAMLGPRYTNVEEKLKFLDQNDIDAALLSLGNPWLDFLPTGVALQSIQEINDGLISACEEFPGRLWYLAALPFTSLEEAHIELERIASHPKVVGFLTGMRIADRWLDDESLTSLIERLEALQLPIFLHPHQSIGGSDLDTGAYHLRTAFGFPFETSVVAARLIINGVIDRFPNLKIVLPHGGGVLPALAGRLEAYFSPSETDSKAIILKSLRNFYYDAITYHPAVLRMLIELVGSDRILFGTDHPFSARDPELLISVINGTGLDSAEIGGILGNNALKLFSKIL